MQRFHMLLTINDFNIVTQSLDEVLYFNRRMFIKKEI